MSTIDLRHSRVEGYDREKDIIVNLVDDSHVRLMKLFPMCQEKNKIPKDHYKRFHLRFYMPRDIYHDKCLKIDKVIIMINGLNELDYFTLYDQLGQSLAKQGYASVLLPLPNHLNRNRQYRFNAPAKREIPSDSFTSEKTKVYDAYVQMHEELTILVRHLKGKCSKKQKKNEDKCDFYSHIFNSDLRVSVLGYSLGGLVALSYCLAHKDDINSCFLINSGAKLADIDVSYFMSKLEWIKLTKKITSDWEISHDNTTEAKLFNRVFIGNSPELLKDDLKQISRRLIFILGGSDTVTTYDSIKKIEPENYGLSILKLPGIHHFVSIDTEWNKWFKIIVNTIWQFDESSYKDSLSYNEILSELVRYQMEYHIFSDCNGYCIEKITDEQDKHYFHRVICPNRELR